MIVLPFVILTLISLCGFSRPTSIVIETTESTSFHPSVTTLLNDGQLQQQSRWEVVNHQGQSRCGFSMLFDHHQHDSITTEEDQAEDHLYLGLNCQAITWIVKQLFYDYRSMFTQSLYHYEKKFIYYNIEFTYEVKFRETTASAISTNIMKSSCLTEEERLWLDANPWYFHIQFSGHAPSLTSIPLFKGISWSNHDCFHDDRITKGRYSNNIGWLYESMQPEPEDAITLEMAINLNPSHFDVRFNQSFSHSQSNAQSHVKIMHSLMKKIEIVVNRMAISFVSQPSKLPLNYTIANIDAQQNQQERKEDLHSHEKVILPMALETLDPCRLHDTLDGQVLANITIATTLNMSSTTSLPSTDDKFEKSLPRIFCGIFTMASNHHKARSIRNTWAKKCTFFMAFSTEDDLTIPAINLAHIGEEKYNNMWQKTRSIWKYIHEYYLDEFDWFLLGGDDMYHIVENLMSFLTSDEILAEQQLQQLVQEDVGNDEDPKLTDETAENQENHENQNESESETDAPSSMPGSGLYLGRRLLLPSSEDKGRQIYFNSGGPGYLLDRKAVDLYVRNADKSFCFPHVLRYAEDAFLAGCLIRTKESLFPYDSTNDEEGRPRFHIFSPAQTFLFDTSNRLFWLNRFDPFMKNGSECCSPSSISFHNISESLMYAMDDYLYRCYRK